MSTGISAKPKYPNWQCFPCNNAERCLREDTHAKGKEAEAQLKHMKNKDRVAYKKKIISCRAPPGQRAGERERIARASLVEDSVYSISVEEVGGLLRLNEHQHVDHVSVAEAISEETAREQYWAEVNIDDVIKREVGTQSLVPYPMIP